ncbi:MAG: D-glycero-beta-D-manno-heptose 1-phosphate adenylyltransferase [Chlorobi bacterium]|nr:D-glycero-beta-D-manno-heptose 1-phosphate adenylyltransferase [Chlorobiota bacterium]
MKINRLNLIKEKIKTIEELPFLLSNWKFKNKRVVFTNGCFDILHRGHIEYLTKASELGDILIIGLNTDDSVRKLKGKNRPVQDQESRALILASLSFVSIVVLFDEETPYNLIKLIKPSILVKGSDYQPEEIVGYDILKKYGGEVKTIDFIKGYSTTHILNQGINQ